MNFRKKNELSKIQILKNIGAFFLRVIVVVAVGYSIVAFGGQTVEMVGESMAPVIHNDDILLVNKIKYMIFDPKQMDIILFKVRKSSETYYSVKRVIGVPGDTVQIIDGEVYVNDSKLENPPYVCNGCSENFRCTLKKYFYFFDTADTEYRSTLVKVRQGINLTE